MGPWNLGRWYRPLAVLSVAGCVLLIVVGMQPPNERSIWVVGGAALVLAVTWFGIARHRFPGPPQAALDQATTGRVSSVRLYQRGLRRAHVVRQPVNNTGVSRDLSLDSCLEDLASHRRSRPPAGCASRQYR